MSNVAFSPFGYITLALIIGPFLPRAIIHRGVLVCDFLRRKQPLKGRSGVPDRRPGIGDNRCMDLKRLLLIIAIVLLVLAFVVHRSRQASRDLNVEPHAASEIEKAKRR